MKKIGCIYAPSVPRNQNQASHFRRKLKLGERKGIRRSRFARILSRVEATGEDTQALKNTTDTFVTDIFTDITSQLPLVLDQSAHEDCWIGTGQILASQPVGQEFTPSFSPLLAVEVLVVSFNSPYTDTLTLHIRDGTIDGPILATTSSDIGPVEHSEYVWHRFVLPLPLALTPGSLYVIEVFATNPSFGLAYAQTNLDASCDYPGGVAIVNGLRSEITDRLFRTYTSLSATPQRFLASLPRRSTSTPSQTPVR